MRYELLSGLSIGFDHMGDRNAPALVLLHGLSSYRRTYASVIEHLQPRIDANALQLLNVDLRGHGESGHGPLDGYTADTYAADVCELVRAHIDGPVFVAGHSLGGVVAGAVAAREPSLVRGLFLEDPPYFEGDAAVRNASPVATFFPKMVAAIRELQGRSAPISDYKQLLASMSTPEQLDEKAEVFSRWDPNTMQAAIDGIVWETFNPEAKVLCPLTILQADPAMGGVFKPADGPKVLAANPHANVVPVQGAGHSIRDTHLNVYVTELDRLFNANQ
jgi:pimeloyl-ACP methyl ester carboxylesterase